MNPDNKCHLQRCKGDDRRLAVVPLTYDGNEVWYLICRSCLIDLLTDLEMSKLTKTLQPSSPA